ncbi:MAG: integration host factor subunit beta [Bacteroidales bacterium]|jgi:DNA-binding protein HU-beta|nr:integration host factor subunit beta [Bacteroidales bacterium]
MTKAEIVAEIASKTGIEKNAVQDTVEKFMETVKKSLEKGENVYLRGFGSFIIKERKAKTGRNISKNVPIQIPAHKIPAFKPAKSFVNTIKTKVK